MNFLSKPCFNFSIKKLFCDKGPNFFWRCQLLHGILFVKKINSSDFSQNGLLANHVFWLTTKRKKKSYSCMSRLHCIQWTLRNFYTFHHLVDSYRNAISKWAMRFRDGNFNLELARGKKSLASCRHPGGRQIFGG